jgi:predicted PurR-regulated permease PerM
MVMLVGGCAGRSGESLMSGESGTSRVQSRIRPFLVVLLAVGLIVGLHLLRPVAQALLVLFGGVLLGVFLDGVSSWLNERTRVPRRLALAVMTILVIVLPLAAGWLIGPRIAEQVIELRAKIPQAAESLKSALSRSDWGQRVLETYPEVLSAYRADPSTLARLGGFFTSAVGAFVSALVVLFVGIYVSIAPGVYAGGLVRLFPKDRRARIREVIGAIGTTLRRWIAGRIASMIVVGALTWIGLAVAGIPLALSLAVIAGLLAFVPYVGPVLAAVPAILVALVDEPVKALWVVIIYTMVQIVENYIITPLIQQRAVSIAPALLISIQILMGILYGGLGVLLATPLAVLVMVAVQMLYIEDVLGDRARPGPASGD